VLQVYVQMRNEKMLEDTAKGFKEGRWAWKEPLLVYPGGRKAQDKELDHDSTNLVNASSASDANHTTDQAAHNYINPPRLLYIRLVGLVTPFFLSFLARVRRIVPF
jgi:hypothetical protein